MGIKFLSYPLNTSTPTYGNRLKVNVGKYKSIPEGDTVNESYIELPLHAGTHLDFPKHFFDKGQTFHDFDSDFWLFEKPLLINLEPDELLLNHELIKLLAQVNDIGYDIILVRTGAFRERKTDRYWNENHGIHGDVAAFIRTHFSNVRCIGFDFISLGSIKHREEGKEAHLAFLDPKNPILVIEDMNLSNIDQNEIKELIVSPLCVENVDGVPVTCIAKI